MPNKEYPFFFPPCKKWEGPFRSWVRVPRVTSSEDQRVENIDKRAVGNDSHVDIFTGKTTQWVKSGLG